MTIVEIERVSAPPKEREDAREERERRASVLEAAALEIEVHGWTKGNLCRRTNGKSCLVGGIGRSLGLDKEKLYDNSPSVYEAAGVVWDGAGGNINRGVALFSFNDYDARTAEDVTFLLRWRAEEIRDGR